MSSATVITRERVDELMRSVFSEIRAMGGSVRPKELFARLGPRLTLTPHEREATSSGAVRWETLIRWYTVDCSRAGYLEKSGGYWKLTPLGESLGESVCGVWTWVGRHMPDVERARRVYDRKSERQNAAAAKL